MKVNQVYIGQVKHFAERYYAEEIDSFKKIPNVEYQLFDTSDIEDLLKDNYGTETLESFRTLLPPAFKADLARLAIADTYGGWYADIGTSVANATAMVELSKQQIVMFNETRDPHLRAQQGNLPSIQNGAFFSQANSPLLKKAIEGINKKVKKRYYGVSPWDITGPTHIGGIAYSKPFDKMLLGEFFWTQHPDGHLQYAYVWKDGTNVVWYKSPNKQSMFRHPTLDYHAAWHERRVYSN